MVYAGGKLETESLILKGSQTVQDILWPLLDIDEKLEIYNAIKIIISLTFLISKIKMNNCQQPAEWRREASEAATLYVYRAVQG